MTSLSYTLNTGAKIPAIGLGTWQSPPGAVAAAVEYAIAEAGVRHVDGAFAYRNEEEVGQGIAKAIASGKVKREDIFVTTKVFTTYHNRVEESINESLQNLVLDYVDLLLIHWPVGLNPNGNHLFLGLQPMVLEMSTLHFQLQILGSNLNKCMHQARLEPLVCQTFRYHF